jgi:plastocyanin
MTRLQRLLIVVLVPVVAVSGLLIGRALRADDDAGVGFGNADDVTDFEHDYLIPEGTAARIDRGEEVDLVPRELTARVGEAIRIVNDDDEGHVVGVFYVGPGESLTKRFTAPGELSGTCTVHSTGEFTLRVDA